MYYFVIVLFSTSPYHKLVQVTEYKSLKECKKYSREVNKMKVSGLERNVANCVKNYNREIIKGMIVKNSSEDSTIYVDINSYNRMKED